MRIRTVKPEWLEDEKIALASTEARLLSIALLLLADDYGNGRAHLAILGPRVFPGAQNPRETLAKALDELARLSFVVLYEVEGQSYFHIRNWDRHQRVDKPGKPQCPAPPHEIQHDLQHSRDSRETPENIRESLAPDQDQDQDQEGTCSRPSRVPARAHDDGATADGGDDGRETACPLDLASKLPDGMLSELADGHRVPQAAIERALAEFVTFWTIGGGAGRRRRNWLKQFRIRCQELAKRGDLAAVDAASRSGQRSQQVPRKHNDTAADVDAYIARTHGGAA